jgi:glycosyltransferase involved in cell wall biosynthesis
MARHLNILFDARPLVDQHSGGVRRVAHMVLEQLIAECPDAEITCATTGLRKPSLPEPFATHPRITHTHLSIPNKLWSLLAMFGIVSLDSVAARAQKENGKWKMVNGSKEYFPFSIFHFPFSSHSKATKSQSIPRNHATTQPRPSPFDAVLLPNLGFVGFMEAPYALILHDCSFLIEPRWFPLKMQYWHLAVNPKEITRRAQRIFCVSETTARDAGRLLKIPREKIRVFQPGVPGMNVTSHESRVTSSDATPFVLTFSENDPRKNTVTAIAAVEELRKEEKFKNLRLVIVGSKMENGKWKMENGRSSNTLSDLPTPPPPTPYDFTT